MRIPINFFLFLTVTFFSNSALASTVTTTADSGPGSLRAAISNAVPGEVIDFAVSGTITLTSGELLILRSLTITGPGADNLTIQRSPAGGTPDFRIFNVSPGIASISGLTLQNGRDDFGGGIHNEATLLLRDCVIQDNVATDSGGGINNVSSLTMSNCIVRENSVIGSAGNRYGGGLNNTGTATVLNCQISTNTVTGGTGVFCLGGGVNNDGTMAITNSLIEGNSAVATLDADSTGGGIWNQGTLTVHTTTVRFNLAMGGSGNDGAGEGGGIGNSFGTVTLDRSTVSGNLAVGQAGAGTGGGIYNRSGTVIVESSTVSGNAANSTSGPARGGGFANGSGSLTLSHATLTTNVVPATGFGSGVDNANGVVELKNSIVAGNGSASDFFNGVTANVNSEGFNLIGTITGLIDPGLSDRFNVTAATLLVGPLQDNGGPTFTHALLCGSPAINAGDNTGAPPTDQRGFPRIVSGIIDIGAFEGDNTAPTITCSGSITSNCAPPTGLPVTVSVNVSDVDGDRLTVVWFVDGTSYQTNTVPAGRPPTTNHMDFTALFGVGPHVVNVSVTDSDDCAATCTMTVTVNADRSVPFINCLGNKTNECGAGSLVFDQPTAGDDCGAVITVLNTVTNLGCGNTFVATRTWVATDSTGNTNTCRQTIASVDTTAPVLTCPSNLTVSCSSQVPAPNTNSVTANDGCGGAVTVIWQTDSVSASNCVGQFVLTRTYRAMDQCGNSATCAQTITVQDTNPPSIICPSNLTVNCSSQVPAPNTNSVTASDNCGGAVAVTWQADSISASNCVGQFILTRNYRATDQCGNSATCTQTIIVQDTNPPSITCSANKTNLCGGSGLAFDTPAVSDGCGSATLTILSTVTNLTVDGTFVATRTWVATDPCGNSSSCSQTLVAVNGTAPTVSCVSPVTVNCGSATGTVATVYADVADADGDPLTVVWTVDGRPAQTNTIPAGGPPTTGRADFTTVFTVGTHIISVTVFDMGCEATCTTTVTINPAAIGNLYPIALHIDSLTGVPVGGIIPDIYNGVQPGNFGWLTWAGSPSEPTLVTSLTPPGNSSTYINPRNRNDHTVSVGDWVQGKPGVTNADKVRKALDTLKQIDIVVPVWDRAAGRGNGSLYHVVRFARVRITDYRLPKQNRITARFLGFVDCQ